MSKYLYNIPDDISERLYKLSKSSGEKIIDELNWMVRNSISIREGHISGAKILGVEVHTTSGSLWVGRGL